jgi:ketosteroid isomerase-like protein
VLAEFCTRIRAAPVPRHARDALKAARRREMGGSQEAANKALVRTFFDALSRADVEAVRELYAEDFELWTASIDAMTAEGERVAVEAKSEGVHTSGARYHNRYHFLLVVRDGRITELKEYLDTEHAREVLAGGSAAAAAAGGDDR